MIKMTNYRRLPLKKLNNCRELGGFVTPDGYTKYGVFLRSELPFDLPGEDIEALKDYGVRACLDFRGQEELDRIENTLKTQDFIDYRSLPMFEVHVAPKNSKPQDFDISKFSWHKTYVNMLETYKDWTYRILNAAAETEGVTLYNCTTGKDRTGLCTMLLLSIAGVDKADIVADYCVSMVYMKMVYPTIDFGGELPDPFMRTPAEGMGDTIDYLEEKYGSVMEYIKSCGVDEKTVARIREKLVERE